MTNVNFQLRHVFNNHAGENFQFNPLANKDVVLSLLAEQNVDIIEEMNSIKNDIKGSFLELAKNVEDCIKELKDDTKKKFDSTNDCLAKLHTKIVNLTANSNLGNNLPPPTSTIPAAAPTTTRPMPSPEPSTSTSIPSTAYLKMPKVLYVADSVGHSADLNNIEIASKTRIRSRKAYSSKKNNIAKYPESNFYDVVRKELGNQNNDKFDVLVMSAPTVDITNLDTSQLNPNSNIEVFKDEIRSSCVNMFDTAHTSLQENPNLKKVVIMEHPTRFDSAELDPVGLKPALAEFANTFLSHVWSKSPLNEKIVIGCHSFDNNVAHDSLFQDRRINRNDGVHLYGPKGRKVYTESVLKIVRQNVVGLNNPPSQKSNRKPRNNNPSSEDDHRQCPQTKYQQKKSSQAYHPSVQIMNRFSVFNSNSGNQ